jgi:ElaB/YqjD/DUF883 family membrane-anchored ribosome-binding protein
MNDELNEPDAIRQQMEQTRESLQSKLETLEQQVKDTVQEATGAVTDTVDAVKETVETVKDTVQGTVDTMRETVQETVASVKDTLDLSQHVKDHPWLMFAGATLVGFAGTRLLSRALAPKESLEPVLAPLAAPPPPAARNGHSSASPAAPPPARASWWDALTEHYGDELAKLKGLVVGTAGGVVREVLTANVGPVLAEQVKDVVNTFTTKLGGHVIEGPILESFTGPRPDPQERSQERPYEATDKVLATARW